MTLYPCCCSAHHLHATAARTLQCLHAAPCMQTLSPDHEQVSSRTHSIDPLPHRQRALSALSSSANNLTATYLRAVEVESCRLKSFRTARRYSFMKFHNK